MAVLDRDKYTRELHRRLVEGDPIAPSELVEAYMDELVRRVHAKARVTGDEALIHDAVTDALLAYVQQPTKYSPDKSGLLTYLTMSAHRDFLNMMERERRRSNREFPLENVEHSPLGRNKWIEAVEETVVDREGSITPREKALLWQHVSEQFSDPTDRRLLGLMLNGERKTAAYSAVLGIQDSDQDEQRRLVKRHKDRLTKRLVRLGGKIRGRSDKG